MRLLILLLVTFACVAYAAYGATRSPKELRHGKHFHDILQEIRKQGRKHLHSGNPSARAAQMERRKHRHNLRQGGDTIAEINTNINSAANYYEGDIKLTDDQAQELLTAEINEEEDGEQREKRQAKRQAFFNRWSKVYYNWYNITTHAQTVAQLAFEFWGNHTCINFEKNAQATPRLNFISADGCWSYIGQINSMPVQDISLGPNCDAKGIAEHEIGHALGFFHEQSRWDRDKYISVFPNNMQAGWDAQFNRETEVVNDNMGFTYDYGGIMHYAADGVALPGTIAVEAADAKYQDTMGSHVVSFRDVAEMNALYCPDSCAGTTTVCQNGGIPHPRDCSKCLCPGGFGGRLCDTRPEGCGATLTATATEQQIKLSVGTGAFTVMDKFQFCNWAIVAPEGKKVEARLVSLTENQCHGGCQYGGVEFKWRPDTTITGSRVCCSADAGTVYTSSFHVLPVIGYNKYYKEQFTLAYKYV